MLVLKALRHGHRNLSLVGDGKPQVVGVGDPGTLIVSVYGNVLGILVGLIRSEDLNVIKDITRAASPNLEANKE